MKRKLVQQGTSTMMVSLPSKWIKTNGLEKGSEIDLEELGNDLIISATNISSKKEIGLSLTEIESSIRTQITNAYRMGFDKINVAFTRESQFDVLKNTVENLIGFEITKTQSNNCIIENITEPNEAQFDNILNKIFLSIEELFEITIKRMKGQEENYEEVSQRIMKFDNFCRRVISKRKMIEKSSESFWNFLSSMIRGQRELFFLNKALGKASKVSSELQDLLFGCLHMFQMIMNSYKQKNLSKLEKIHELEKNLIYKDVYSLLEKIKGKENIYVYRIASSIRQFYLASSPLSSLIL